MDVGAHAVRVEHLVAALGAQWTRVVEFKLTNVQILLDYEHLLAPGHLCRVAVATTVVVAAGIIVLGR